MELYRLLKYRYLMLRNNLVAQKRGKAVKLVLVACFGTLFLSLEYLFFLKVFSYFANLPLDIGSLLIIQMFNMIFLTFFSMLVFSNIITSLSTVYLSQDLELLMALPIKVTNIFILKFIQTIINSSWIIFLFALPIFMASETVEHASSSFYLQIMFLFIPFLVIPGSIGVMTTMLLMRFFPARKAYQVLSLLGLVFGTGLIVFFRLLRPERLWKDVSDVALLKFMESLKIPDYSFLPSTWLTKGYLASLGNYDFSYLYSLLLLTASALFAFSMSIIIAARMYRFALVEKPAVIRSSAGGSRAIIDRLLDCFLKVMPVDQKSLWLKDIKFFWRETSQWSQLFMLGALAILYIYNMRNLPLETIFIKNMVSLLNIALAGFVLAAVSLRFTYTGISLEGRAIWIIISAPLKPRSLIVQKFLFYFFPLVFLAEILVISSNYFLGTDNYIMVVSAGTIFFITLALTGLGTGLGARYPCFIYENPSEIGFSTGGIIYMLCSLTYIGLVISLEARPIYLHLANKLNLVPPPGNEVLIYYSLVIILSLALTVIPLALGVAAVKDQEV